MPALVPHPQTPGGALRGISAGAARASPGELRVRFVLAGDLRRVRIPPPAPPRVVAGLWQHTCCEIFIARAGSAAYHEFNLSPSGEWAAHAFTRYREGRLLDDAALDPNIVVRRGAATLELEALIRTEEKAIRVALAAVLESTAGELSYWALRHPPGRPDFHHREGFALEIE